MRSACGRPLFSPGPSADSTDYATTNATEKQRHKDTPVLKGLSYSVLLTFRIVAACEEFLRQHARPKPLLSSRGSDSALFF